MAKDDARRASTADEQTPLLATTLQDPQNRVNEGEILEHANGSAPAETPQEDVDKPLPMGQIALIGFAGCIEVICFFGIFPFVPGMVASTGVKEGDVGFWTGLIESIYSLVQMVVMPLWGKASDRYGRKPGMVISMLGLAIASTLFGLSKAVWQMILFRSLCGVFSGSVVSIRAMFQEMSTPKTQARAFSWFAFSRNLGIFFGPVVGSLARPADQYPNTFGHIKFFHDWPYILPTSIIGVFGILACITTALFVKETLPENLQTKTSGKKTMSTWELFHQPGVAVAVLLYIWGAMLGFGFTATVPVYFFTSINRGGFGFSEREISLFISINGASQAVWLLFVFPPLQRRIGTKRILNGCGAFWPFLFLILTLNNQFLRHGLDKVFWIFAPISMVLGSGVAMAFTGTQLTLNDATPSPELLGTLNGIALSFQSGTRAVMPTLFGSIYAVGVKHNILGGQLGMVVLAVLAVGFFGITFAISDRTKEEQKAANGTATNDEESAAANGGSAGQRGE